jgi:ubiquitin C-terminal hydrolase
MQSMWSTSHTVYPRQFKKCIGGINDQFQGYDQQDSLEFLSFLLDGLHEELNLRQEKPFCENPDSDNRNVVDLGLESWSNALRRDWSFIHFLFSGQLKSTLNCQACSKESITFDTFTSIPLSLPEPSKLLINVVIYRLPRRLKDLLSGKPP